VITNLIWIDREGIHPMNLVEQPKRLRVNPGSFAIAIRGKSIETDFSPVKKRAGFKVINWYTVFHGDAGKISTQRQSPVRRHSTKIDFGPASNIRLHHPYRVGDAGSIQLAVPDTEHLLHQVERLHRL